MFLALEWYIFSHSKCSGKPLTQTQPNKHLSSFCFPSLALYLCLCSVFNFLPCFCHKSHISVSTLLLIDSGTHYFFASYLSLCIPMKSLFFSWFSQPLINIPCSLPVSEREWTRGRQRDVAWGGGRKEEQVVSCTLGPLFFRLGPLGVAESLAQVTKAPKAFFRPISLSSESLRYYLCLNFTDILMAIYSKQWHFALHSTTFFEAIPTNKGPPDRGN